ncbi:DTW domain-containing protein [Rhodoblastus acidophilus]|uniref:tRNA-uridine aminocarboxypropyltransferase n=1 Tax=Candidatus Rhodoblastus alkanivorans TaxID=2954117 RepID=A0ABS9ZAD6_9HYPH|nr:tRNA-uridine aminocarboxypropyltransferase [Candidatus Rhodoblastus alkanivorans]MCI4677256.1 DTW domain-containing protein [Candidatus Rhodoblastus alkanivorans]MCI4684608.1 DTW domain-containing protein [Candidatus Rhodoblastus alkanivorans]MDI4641930.1 DTW domain-containing protein [Rhodoblastus acidophilus]
MTPSDAPPLCPHCAKPDFLCVCGEVEAIDNRVALLILQHPQEQDRLLGTARLALRALKNAQLKIGLSWPSLAKILGRDADPSEWAILHLGAGHARNFPSDRELIALDKTGAPLPDQDRALKGLKGVVIFDGSWAQAKTLWWRNPWVLKAKRLALNPRKSSLYGALRREPRREALSTIEAAGLALSRMEGRPEIETALLKDFSAMLDKYRAALASGAVTPPAPSRRPGPPRRRPRKPAPPAA